METEPQITLRGLNPTPEITRLINEKIAKLEKVHDRITSCRVTVELPHTKGRKGHIYHVAVELEVPTGVVIVNRKPGNVNAHESLKVALRDSFASARRQLIGHVRQNDNVHVKSHPVKLLGTVVDIFPEDGFGFLETASGEEVYFQRGSIVGENWNDIAIGKMLHFSLMEGEKGPFAVNVSLRA